MRRAVLLLTVLLTPALFAEHDGPSIRVLLGTGREGRTFRVSGDSEREELLVVDEFGQRRLRGGVHELRLQGEAAQLIRDDQIVVDFTRAFRLQGASSFVTWVEDSRARDVHGKPLDPKQLAGWIEVWPPAEPEKPWLVANRLPLEAYLLGVVGHEMPASAPMAALEAQAIASRTYALYEITRRGAQNSWHVYGDVNSQVYGGLYKVPDRVRDAVENTRGQVLLYDGRLFKAYFHSTCGGGTNDAHQRFRAPRIAPLQSVPCHYCQPDNRHYSWSEKIPRATVAAKLRGECQRYGVEVGDLTGIQTITARPGAHADYVRVLHTKGSFELAGSVFRHSVGLKSSRFECRPDPNDGQQLIFTGYGWGHGVGMCQRGAMNLGRSYDAVAILQYYYQGSVVGVLWE